MNRLCRHCWAAQIEPGREKFCSDRCRIRSADAARRRRQSVIRCAAVTCDRSVSRRDLCARHLAYAKTGFVGEATS